MQNFEIHGLLHGRGRRVQPGNVNRCLESDRVINPRSLYGFDDCIREELYSTTWLSAPTFLARTLGIAGIRFVIGC